MDPDFRFDKRIIQRNLQKGTVSPSELEAYLKNLKDVSVEAMPFESSPRPSGRRIPTRVLDEDDEL